MKQTEGKDELFDDKDAPYLKDMLKLMIRHKTVVSKYFNHLKEMKVDQKEICQKTIRAVVGSFIFALKDMPDELKVEVISGIIANNEELLMKDMQKRLSGMMDTGKPDKSYIG